MADCPAPPWSRKQTPVQSPHLVGQRPVRLPHQSTSSRSHGQRQCKKLKSRLRKRRSRKNNRRSHGCSDVEASDGTQSINRTQDGIKMELRHRAKMPCGLSGFEPHETWFRTHLPPFLRHRHSHCSSWEHARKAAFQRYKKAAFQRYKNGTFVNGWKQSLMISSTLL